MIDFSALFRYWAIHLIHVSSAMWISWETKEFTALLVTPSSVTIVPPDVVIRPHTPHWWAARGNGRTRNGTRPYRGFALGFFTLCALHPNRKKNVLYWARHFNFSTVTIVIISCTVGILDRTTMSVRGHSGANSTGLFPKINSQRCCSFLPTVCGPV